MRPIRFAHTNSEVPKYGASNREAESSTASEQAPATNTSKTSNQPCIERPAVEATAPFSSGSTWELEVVVDIGKLSFVFLISIVSYLATSVERVPLLPPREQYGASEQNRLAPFYSQVLSGTAQ